MVHFGNWDDEAIEDPSQEDDMIEKNAFLTTVKPECKLAGTDGNVFSIIGKVTLALKRAGQPDKATEFAKRAFESGDYNSVLKLCFEYVDVT